MKYTAETMLVRSCDGGGTGEFSRVTPGQAGWEYLSMYALRLNRGQRHAAHTGGNELALVILGGRLQRPLGAGELCRGGGVGQMCSAECPGRFICRATRPGSWKRTRTVSKLRPAKSLSNATILRSW